MAYRKTAKPTSPTSLKAYSEKIPPISPLESSSGWSPPSHAAYIWLDGEGNLRLGLPSTLPGKGHSVRLTPDERGLSQLVSTLKARAMARTPATIATQSSPCQAMLDALASQEAQNRLTRLDEERRFKSLSSSEILDELAQDLDSLFSSLGDPS